MIWKPDLFNCFIDLIFPRICFFCNVRSTKMLCADCLEKLVFLNELCPICSSTVIDRVCQKCSEKNFVFDQLNSVFQYNKVIQKLIHDLKYHELKIVADYLAEHCLEFIERNDLYLDVDLVIPVPLHRTRYRARGYNQAEIISLPVAKFLNCDHNPKLVKRAHFTKTQTRLGRSDRQKNVAGAFRINPKYSVYGKRILVIDDVFTTGSTLNAISQILKESGTLSIRVLTIAHA